MTILMEDLLKEITSLSTRLDESQSDSNSTSEVGAQNSLGNQQGTDSLQMRNKTRSKKRRERKRKIDCHPELYTESESSILNSSEDEALRDYIVNVTSAVVSDSDEDFVPRRRVNLLNGVPWSPLEVGESDSFSENILSLNSRKKRKIKKMNKKLKALESLEQISIPVDEEMMVMEKIGQLRRELKQKQSKKMKRRKQKAINKNEGATMETDLDVKKQKIADANCDDDDDMKGSDTSAEDESQSEGLSSGSNEADDEGEESCVEATIPVAIPFWDDEDMLESAEEKDFKLILSQSFGVLDEEYREDLHREANKKCLGMAAAKLNDNNNNFLMYANKRIKTFLQREDGTEFYLNVSCDTEQDQILELASLYSLCCHIKDTSTKKRILLTKTKNTREPDRRILKRFLKQWEIRKSRPMPGTPQRWSSKRRKTTSTESFSTENATPIPESNIGNQMLRNMGWIPGTGLGRDANGIIKPVATYKRPKKLGLGHPIQN